MSSKLLPFLNRPLTAVLLALALLTLGFLPNAKGSPQPAGSGTLTETATGATFNTFALTLQNTGTPSLQTFWFGWVPGKDFLDSQPTVTGTPTGWTVAQILNSGGSDGYSIEFTTSTAPLASGNGLSGFTFTSADSLAQMAGNSAFYSGSAATTSEVNSGANDGGNSSNPFVVTVVVPEPGSVALLAGALGLCFWKARRRA